YMGRFTLTTYFTDRRSNEMIEQLDGICPFDVTMKGKIRAEYQWNSDDAVYLDDFEWLWTKMNSEASETVYDWCAKS
ncbi:ABC transporter ATP-binding protein, partial [Pseudomonadota bacterium]